MNEQRRCNECGEEWNDTGDYTCPFCGSVDTEIVESDKTPQAKLDILLPAAQQASSLLEAIRMDTPWMVSPGVRELYQVIDEDLVAALEAVTK